MVEIVLDGLLAAPGDEHEMLDAGRARLGDDVGQDRPVHDVEQFLGHGLGAGQDARAEARDGQDSFTDRLHAQTLAIR